MPRANRIALALAVGCCALAAGTNAAAAAQTSRGTLSATEYAQLAAASSGLNRSAHGSSIHWTQARRACRRTGGETALLRGQRTSCLSGLRTLEALARFPVEQRRCKQTDATDTTTTDTTMSGTTTDSSDTAEIELVVCMNPRYQTLSRAAKASYRADATARRRALSRGFKGACLATLASTRKQLANEKLFAADSAKLAADVVLLIKVTRGQTPTSELDQTGLNRDVSSFEHTGKAVLAETSPQKLSACPHA